MDTVSTNATCTFAAAPLAGTPVTAGIFMDKKPTSFFAEGTPVTPVPGVPTTPIVPCIDPTGGTRIIKTLINKSIYIQKLKPALQGDEAFIAGTPRPLTAPFAPSSVQFQTGAGAAAGGAAEAA
tara:strand:+ start:98 stop:469 length:372 start_codon:yes stop_codon:yes gene_type:complete